MSVMLTAEERARFVDYLTEMADTDEKIAEQMDGLRAGKLLAEGVRDRVRSFRHVARYLAAVEDYSVRGEP